MRRARLGPDVVALLDGRFSSSVPGRVDHSQSVSIERGGVGSGLRPQVEVRVNAPFTAQSHSREVESLETLLGREGCVRGRLDDRIMVCRSRVRPAEAGAGRT